MDTPSRLNWHVTVFVTALVLIAWTLSAMTPVLRLPFAGLRAGLAEAVRGSEGTVWRHLGARLVVLELVTTMVLLAGTGLLAKSFYELLHVDIGFVPSQNCRGSVSIRCMRARTPATFPPPIRTSVPITARNAHASWRKWSQAAGRARQPARVPATGADGTVSRVTEPDGF